MANVNGPLGKVGYILVLLIALWFLYVQIPYFHALVNQFLRFVIIAVLAGAFVGLGYLYLRGGGDR